MKLYCINSQYREGDYIAYADCKDAALQGYAEDLEIDMDLVMDCETVTIRQLPTPDQVLDFFRVTENALNTGLDLFSADDLKEIALYCAYTDKQYETIDNLF